MSSDYRVATGHGVALVSLNTVSPQPMGRPIRPTQRTQGLSGAIYDLGQHTEWLFEGISNTTQYVTLLTQFGLHAATTANVTIYTRNSRLAYARYNAVAVLPEMGRDADWNNYFLRGITIVLKNLEAL